MPCVFGRYRLEYEEHGQTRRRIMIQESAFRSSENSEDKGGTTIALAPGGELLGSFGWISLSPGGGEEDGTTRFRVDLLQELQ